MTLGQGLHHACHVRLLCHGTVTASRRGGVGAGALDEEVAVYCKAEGIPYFSMYGEGGGVYDELAGEASLDHVLGISLSLFFVIPCACNKTWTNEGVLREPYNWVIWSLHAWVNRVHEAQEQVCTGAVLPQDRLGARDHGLRRGRCHVRCGHCLAAGPHRLLCRVSVPDSPVPSCMAARSPMQSVDVLLMSYHLKCFMYKAGDPCWLPDA